MHMYAELAINLFQQGVPLAEINQVLYVIGGGNAPPFTGELLPEDKPTIVPPAPPTQRKRYDSKKLVKPLTHYGKSKNGHGFTGKEAALALYSENHEADESQDQFSKRLSWALTHAVSGKLITRVARGSYIAT